MLRERPVVLDDLTRAVIEMDQGLARSAAQAAIDQGINPYDAIIEGLGKGMDRANELFESEEYFVPDSSFALTRCTQA